MRSENFKSVQKILDKFRKEIKQISNRISSWFSVEIIIESTLVDQLIMVKGTISSQYLDENK